MTAPFLKRPLRVVFLGTPDVVLPAAEHLRLASETCQVVAVVTQQPARRGRGAASAEMPSPVHKWALEHNIPVHTPAKVGDPAFLELLRTYEADVCVTAAFGQYLPRSFLGLTPLGVLNLHPSLLPAYRGAAPVQRAIASGDQETGISVLFSTPQMDAGPIAAQERTVIGPKDTSASLLPALFSRGAELLLGVLQAYQRGGLEAVPRQEQDSSRATLAPKITASEAFVHPTELDAHTIVNRMRAFDLWPGIKIVFEIRNEPVEVKVLEATAAQATPADRSSDSGDRVPGSAWFDDTSLSILCKNGETVLRLTQLQLPSKRPVLASVVRNGWPGGTPKVMMPPSSPESRPVEA